MRRWLRSSNVWTWSLCVLLALTVAYLVPRVYRDWKGSLLLQEAMAVQDPSKALVLLDQARDQLPGNPRLRQPLLASYNSRAVTLDGEGHNELAARFFQRALDIDPSHGTILQNYAVSLNNRAVVLSSDKKYPESQRLFEEATELLGRLPVADIHDQVRLNYSSLLTVWGQSLMKTGDDAAARNSFEEAVRLNTTNTVARIALGDLAYDTNDFRKARMLYQSGLESGSQSLDYLQARLDILDGELAVSAPLLDVPDSTGAFWLQVPPDLPEDRRVALLITLKKARTHVELFYGLRFTRRINVRLFSSRDFYKISKLPEWAIGSYDGKIRIKVDDLDRGYKHLENLLAHELAHALMGVHVPVEVPAWFHEGMAQLSEPWADSSANADLQIRRLSAVFRQGARVPTNQSSFRELTRHQDADIAYLLSKAFILHLRDSYSLAHIQQFIAQLAKGDRPFEEVFDEVFGVQVEEAESRWRQLLMDRSSPLPQRHPAPRSIYSVR